MKRNGFAPIIFLIVAVVILAIGGMWYFKTRPASPPAAVAEGCTLLPYAGTIPLSQAQYYSPGAEDLRGGMICNFIINPALSVFTFHFTGNEDNTLGDITITEGSNGKTIQTIVNTTSYDATLTQATATLALVDANFDGYNDLQILNNCGVTGNCSYDFYLYDSATNQFVQNAFLSGLGTPTFDVAKQQVRTSWNSSAGDWEADTYQYENSHYTVVHQEISTWNRNANTVTVDTYNLLDGQMKLTNSSTTPF